MARTLGRVRRATVYVVFLSLLLAVVLESLLVVVAATSGGAVGPGSAMVDLVGKVPWAVFVCTGIWLGLKIGDGHPLWA